MKNVLVTTNLANSRLLRIKHMSDLAHNTLATLRHKRINSVVAGCAYEFRFSAHCPCSVSQSSTVWIFLDIAVGKI